MIACSNRALLSKDFSPLPLASWQSDLAASRKGETSPGDIAAFLERSPHPVILVDNTSSECLANSYPLLIDQGISITTPNKKAFSSDLGLWNNIFNAAGKHKKGLILHEATVGAALPVISTLNDIIDTGDEVVSIEGILSGALSYIFNEFSKVDGCTAKFSDVVSKAQQLGFTEPDPREDLNGMNVARKFTILSRIAGYKINNPNHIRMKSLVPKAIREVATVEEFLLKLSSQDNELQKLRAEAESENKVLRYIGKLDMTGKPIVKVGIEK